MKAYLKGFVTHVVDIVREEPLVAVALLVAGVIFGAIFL